MGCYILHIDGELLGVTNQEPLSDLYGASIIYYEGDVYLNHMTWDKETLSFVWKYRNIISKLEFMIRFTSNERVSIRASTDPIITDYLKLLDIAESIDLLNPNLQSGVYYLAHTGYITWERADVILGTTYASD
jgi:hypothetical protein